MKQLNDFNLSEKDLWVFDNDGTLYDDKNLQKVTEDLMDQFFAAMLGVSDEEGHNCRKDMRSKHGNCSTLIALYREGLAKKVLDDFIKKTYLATDKKNLKDDLHSTLTNRLTKIPGTKIILTNAPSAFARQIVGNLGIGDFFEAIYGIEEVDFSQKPDIAAFKHITPYIKEGRRTFFVDDKLENVLTSLSIGCIGIWWNSKKLFLVTSREELHEIA